MPSTRDIKRRIRSIKNTEQITRAMEMVAAAKMRRAQEAALKTRAYAKKALEILEDVSVKAARRMHPLLRREEKIKKILILLITSDRGLCGGLNANVIKMALDYIEKERKGREIDFVCLGKKGRDYMQRLGQNIVAEFINIKDKFTLLDVTPMAQIPLDDFSAKKYDKVILIYPDFISTLKQVPKVKQLLPFQREEMIRLSELGKNVPEKIEEKKRKEYEYLFEPSPEKVLATLLPRLCEMQIYQALCEAKASEHSARMIAMKNASENAEEIIQDLTMSYNQARQAAITKELTEISAGGAALE